MNSLAIIKYNNYNKGFWNSKLDSSNYVLVQGSQASNQIQFLNCDTMILDFYFSTTSEEEEKEIIASCVAQLQNRPTPVTLFVLSPCYTGSIMLNQHKENVQLIAHNFCGSMLELINATTHNQNLKAS